MRHFRALIGLFVLMATLIPIFAFVPTAAADSPTPCYSDSSMPRTYTHGSPITGLVPRHGYYYLDVKYGSGCGLGADGQIHIVATVQVHTIVTKIGALPGTPPAVTREQAWFLEFHNHTGTVILNADSPGVTLTVGDHMTCVPGSSAEPCVCAEGTETVVMRYNGPDIFGLSSGSDVRFRVANEDQGTDSAIVTDFATLSIVATSTSPPRTSE